MKDFVGKELVVGQTVAMCLPYYKHLVKGRVEKIGKAMVTCSYEGPWGEGSTPRYPNQVMVINDINHEYVSELERKLNATTGSDSV